MLYVHVSYGNEETGNWEGVEIVPLIPYKELYPEEKVMRDDSFGLNNESVTLPNGETISISVAFWSANNSISFVIVKDDITLLNLGTFKQKLETFDPSVVFRTPGGLDLSFMFSTRNA
ncbi:hypothetical protein [Neptuniibacter sp. QD57_21]|uniref:hypothetical protein n=1 Tax=Neptuniibacter sp. QD57_21 TaxID=3398213 RepID=UPI0039F4585D